jgi:hypothetical protein
MALTSIFDLGSITATLLNSNGSVTYYEGPLTKGDTFTFPNDEREIQLELACDNSGLVTLSSDGSWTPGDSYELRLAPSYSMGAAAVQYSSFSFDPGVNDGSGYLDASVGGSYQAFTSFNPAEPDPMELTDLSGPHSIFGLYLTNGA